MYEGGGAYVDSITYTMQNPDNSLKTLSVYIEEDIEFSDPETFFFVDGGDWVSVTLEIYDFYVEGIYVGAEEPIDFLLHLDLIEIDLKASESVHIEDSSYLLEMAQPNYFSEIRFEDFDFDIGTLEITDANDETTEILDLAYDQMQGQTTLFVDHDENGQVDSEERERPVATADEEEVSSGEVGLTTDHSSNDDDIVEDNITPSPEEESYNAEEDSYSYTTGCSDSNLTMAFLPLFFIIRVRRKSQISAS
jgi:hypothetical protein